MDKEATLHLGASLRLLRAALSLAALLVVLSACGGSEGQAPPTVAGDSDYRADGSNANH